MDPTSTDLSVDYDPITGRSLRPREVPQERQRDVQASPRPFRGCDAQQREHLPKRERALLSPKPQSPQTPASPQSPLDATAAERSVDYDPLEDGSGWNADAGAQTPFGIQIRRHFNDMRSAFLFLDQDRDGRVGKEELKSICRKWMIPMSEARRVLKVADLNNDGTLDFDEFAQRFDPFLNSEDAPVEHRRNPADDRPIGGTGGVRACPVNQPCQECVKLRAENEELRRRLAELEGRLAHLQGTADAAMRDRDKLERERMAAEERAREERERLERERFDAEDRARRQRERDREEREERERAERAAAEAVRNAAKQAEIEAMEMAKRRAQEELDRQKELDAEAEANTVFVYGRTGSPETEAMRKALRDAGIPFQSRDFDTDKRYMDALTKNGGGGTRHNPPIVVLGEKAWWDDPGSRGDGMFDIPFPSAVAMELRHLLGIKAKHKDTSKTAPVRNDADIDTEIAERFTTMQQAFLHIDYDQDGYVTKDELIARCREWNVPISEADRIMREADKDRDGALDFDEFAKRFSPRFISRSNNGRGCYKGAAPAPTNYSSPKPDIYEDRLDSPGSPDSRERKTTKVRKDRKEQTELRGVRESRGGEHKTATPGKHLDPREARERDARDARKDVKESRGVGEHRETREREKKGTKTKEERSRRPASHA